MKRQNQKIFAIGLMLSMTMISLLVFSSAAAEKSTPAISFSWDDQYNVLNIISAESNYYYSGPNITGGPVNGSYFVYANLVFLKDYNHYYYVGSNMTLTDHIYPSINEIKTGDNIYGFTEGTYMVKWKPTGAILFNFSVSESEPDGQLVVNAPSSVYEENNFFVSVTCDGSPISGVTVSFRNISYLTNLNGTFIEAPQVQSDHSYNIIASKEGYESDTKSILVRDGNSSDDELEISAPSSVDEGDSFLVLVSCDGSPVEGVHVSFLNGSYFTSLNGTVLVAPMVQSDRSFNIHAIKDSYESDTKSITVVDGDSNPVNQSINISKEKLREIGGNETASRIQKAVSEKKVGSEIFIWKNLEKNVTLHEDSLEFKTVDVDKNKLSMIISGNHLLSGKTLVINVEKGFFENNKNIIVEYDGGSIKMASNIEDILDPDDDGSHPEYLIVQGSAGSQILVSIPHFSDHKIDVFSVTDNEASDFFLMIAYYAIVCVLAAVIFVGIIGARKKF